MRTSISNYSRNHCCGSICSQVDSKLFWPEFSFFFFLFKHLKIITCDMLWFHRNFTIQYFNESLSPIVHVYNCTFVYVQHILYNGWYIIFKNSALILYEFSDKVQNSLNVKKKKNPMFLNFSFLKQLLFLMRLRHWSVIGRSDKPLLYSEKNIYSHKSIMTPIGCSVCINFGDQ